MASLGDFLGVVLKEVTTARFQGDLEALKLANIYRNNEYLEGMPIPRFRLPDISVDVPIIISEDVEKSLSNQALDRIPAAELKAGLETALDEADINLKATQVNQLYKVVKTEMDKRWRQSVNLATAFNHIKVLTTAATKWMKAYLSKNANAREEMTRISKAQMVFSRSFGKYLNNHVLGGVDDEIQLRTNVQTGIMREVDDPSILTRLSISIKEDGFEMVKIEREDGTIDERLLPE